MFKYIILIKIENLHFLFELILLNPDFRKSQLRLTGLYEDQMLKLILIKCIKICQTIQQKLTNIAIEKE